MNGVNDRVANGLGGKNMSIIMRHSDTGGFQFFGRLGNRARDSWKDFQYVYTAFSLKYICLIILVTEVYQLSHKT